MIRSTSAFPLLLAAVLASPHATAGSTRITRGDITAVFNSFETAGRKLYSMPYSPAAANAAPADDWGTKGTIRPFEGTTWDGATLCAEDWHVVIVGWFAGPSRQDAIEWISPVVNQFWLNGTQLETQRTAISHVLETTPDLA